MSLSWSEMESDSLSGDLQDMVVQQVIEIAESQLEVPFDDGLLSREEIQASLKTPPLPQSPPPCSVEKPRPTKVHTPRRIKPKLLDALGYTYNIKRIRSRRLTDWQCTVRGKTFACRATIKQKKGSFYPGPQPHLHMPDVDLDQIDTMSGKRRRPTYRKLITAVLPAIDTELHSSKKQKDKTSQNAGNVTVTHYAQPRLFEKSSGFMYLIKSSRSSGTNWKCILRSTSLKCPAVLKQRNGEFTFGRKSHCHKGYVRPYMLLQQKPSVSKKKAIGSIEQQTFKLETPADIADEGIDYEPSLNMLKQVPSSLSQESLALGYRIMEASSQRCGPRLVDAHGYTYNVKRTRGIHTDWQCSIRNKKVRCPAYVKERDGVITPGPQDHIHAPKPGSVIKSIVSSKIKAQAITNALQPAMDIVKDVLMQERPQQRNDLDLKPLNLARMADRLRSASKKKYINSIMYGLAGFHADNAGDAIGDSEDSDHD